MKTQYVRRVRLSLVSEPSAKFPADAVRDQQGVAKCMRALIGDDPREHFAALYLDARHRPIGMHVVSVGSLDSSSVHPREVFGPALMCSAAAIVVCHNHPSGDPTPSEDDRLITEQLRQAGQLLGIELLDHLVLGLDSFFAFSDMRQHKVTP